MWIWPAIDMLLTVLGAIQGDSQNATSRPHHSVQKGQFGLVQLNTLDSSEPDSKKSFNVDIVAIHGLGGDIRSTWTHKNGTFWLQDLLPPSMPGARVFSFGYPSDTFLSPSVAGIRDFAVSLLNAIDNKLREDARGNMKYFRPIIYICHSLGGIVFKQVGMIHWNLKIRGLSPPGDEYSVRSISGGVAPE